MNDEDELRTRLAPLDLYKLTPRNNCGDCGQSTCLAFATLVVSGQEEIDRCPHIDRKHHQALRQRLNKQLDAGIGVSREGFEKTMEFLREEMKRLNLPVIAESLGAQVAEFNGEAALILPYFGDPVVVTQMDVVRPSGSELNAWEKIFIYNYVRGHAAQPSGIWVAMESLPNSVSKIKSLREHCEIPLEKFFIGKLQELSRLTASFGRQMQIEDKSVDFSAEFRVLPNLTIRILFWDAIEGFPSKVKFLFDSRVLQILDLESLIFACEKITDRLINHRPDVQ